MLVLCLAFAIQPVKASDWSTSDTYREAAFQTINLIDWGQTLEISEQCNAGWTTYEQNPLLKSCPSRAEVNRHFAISAALHGLVSYYFPVKYRSAFQYVTIGISGAVVMHNYRIGLKVSF